MKNPESINNLLSTDKLKVIATWEEYASPLYTDIIFDSKEYAAYHRSSSSLTRVKGMMKESVLVELRRPRPTRTSIS